MRISISNMENKSGESKERCETVTLILEANRFEVDKQKLMNKSQYFAALLSENYIDCCQTVEHVINYNIPIITLQDFINWIHNDKLDASVTSFKYGEFDRLLILLELSVLFATDDLVEDVIDMFERYYLLPYYVIDLWLLAQELSVNVLRDLSLAVCLDRFTELPTNLIYNLQREDFLKLIGNINVRSSETYLLDVRNEWMKRHHDMIPINVLQNKQLNILRSIISCENPDFINSEFFIHCWDGNDIFELTSFKYPRDITSHSTGKNMLVGMQIIGRRYDLYICGGEYGIDSGRFNKNVWRYSLISKKWFLQTVMPVERRHMVAVFLKNKLVLVGGVGKNGEELHTVDIYDIYTGLWTLGENVPFDHFPIFDYCVFNEKLLIYGYRTEYVYLPDVNKWSYVRWCIRHIFANINLLAQEMLVPQLNTCYIDTSTPNKMVFRTITEICNIKDCNRANPRCVIIEGLELRFSNPNICFSDNNDDLFHTKTHVKFINISLFRYKMVKYLVRFGNKIINKLHVYSIPIRNPNKFRSLLFPHTSKRFFDLLHPAHLMRTNLDHII